MINLLGRNLVLYFICLKHFQYKGELFPYASEMSKVQWDVEQEFMASLQIKTCISNHDPCKNTCKHCNIPFMKIYSLFIKQSDYFICLIIFIVKLLLKLNRV